MAAARAMGLDLQLPVVESFGIWPDNWDALVIFFKCITQWRVSEGCLLGLDYTAVFSRMDRMGIPISSQDQLMDDIQVMEREYVRLQRSR